MSERRERRWPAEDPYPDWARGRARCPVSRDASLGGESFLVLRHGDAEAVLRDPDTFSSSINQATMGPFMGEVMLAKDGREHGRYRGLVSRAFRPSALRRWERELMQPTIDRLLDGIAGRGRAELVGEVTSRYPVQIIAGIVGVPLEDHERFARWAEEINLGPLHPERGLAASRAMEEYLRPIVEDRRRRPREDLVSDIVTAEIDGRRLRDEEIYGFLRLLMPAGAETTYRVMGSCLAALLVRPEAMERVRADRALVPRAIEETLRWETSVTLVNRVATRDASVGGVAVPAGASLLLALGSANRDESRYERGEAWDIDRAAQPHLAFGWGRHLCLGMHLARLELRVGLNAILDRLPGLRLDPDRAAPRITGYAFRGPERLDVCFEPAGAQAS